MFTCSYCCEEFLFEFKLDEHVRYHHEASDEWPALMFQCSNCPASFLSHELLNQHLSFAHDMESADQPKENLERTAVNFVTTPIRTPRSILKQSGRSVMLSPTSAALRRTINNHKRALSVRRELRFDLPTDQAKNDDCAIMMTTPLSIGSRPQHSFWKIFAKDKPINSKIKRKIRAKACKLSSRSVNQMITSTPMGFSEDNESECDDNDYSIQSNWSSALKTSDFKPLFLTTDRFQCNFCQEKFDCNAELLNHKTKSHRKISFLPAFKCGQCSSTFYRNRQLLRHHHQQC